MKKFIPVVFCSVFLLSGCGNSEKEAPKNLQKKETPPAEFVIRSENFSETLKLTGNLQGKKEIPISAKIAGRLGAVLSDTGDFVKNGSILARYSDINAESQIKHKNALNKLEGTQSTSENMINSIAVQVASDKRNLAQIKKEKSIKIEKEYQGLRTVAKITEVIISDALTFLDKNMGVSAQFKEQELYVLGVSNSALRNILKNDIKQFIINFEKLSKNKDLEIFAQERLNLLETSKDLFFKLNKLTNETFINANFTQNNKDLLSTKITTYLKNISQEITKLEAQTFEFKVAKEQIELNLLSAKNKLKTSQASLDLARANAKNQAIIALSNVNLTASFKEEMLVKAPFSGVIIQKFIEQGELITPGQVLFRLTDISGYKIKTDASDKTVNVLDLGQEVEISIDGISEKFQGKVSKINPALDPISRKLGIEISFKNDYSDKFKKLKIGLFARMKIKLSERKAFFVPRKFVKFDFDGAKVFSKNKEISVEILSEKGNLIEIKSDEIVEKFIILKKF